MHLYTVIIVNYRTETHVVRAVESVLSNAIEHNCGVVIVNNGSATEEAALILERLRSDRVAVIDARCNTGFARGNNIGIRFAISTTNPEFLVIMNPDVELRSRGTIERLVRRITAGDKNTVGAQPLVHNYTLARDPRRSVQIRRVPSVFDLIVTESLVLRPLFPRRHRRFLMLDQIPYPAPIPFHVPSGAFFVIRTDEFSDLGLFDQGTFLYSEELIVGVKLKRSGKHMILDPQECVAHYQGAATRYSVKFRPNWRMNEFRRRSSVYFAKQYLHASRAACIALEVAILSSYWLRLLIWLLSKPMHLFAQARRNLGEPGRRHEQ